MTAVAELLQRAQAATSLDDFGEDSFREGLDVLVASINSEARLSENGRKAYDAQLVDYLAQRLHIEHWYRMHPEIDEQEIVAPLIGLGLPRTGSTALSCLLAEDPAVRSIRSWEAQEPCPPPETATQYTDPRVAKAEAMMERRARMFPRMVMMLPSTATSPTECQTYMAYDFKSQLFQAFVQVPSYVEWLNHKADLVPTYQYVKRVLKLLQWRCPPTRWRLKNPTHSLFIDALAKVFPGRALLDDASRCCQGHSFSDRSLFRADEGVHERRGQDCARQDHDRFLRARHASHDGVPGCRQRSSLFRYLFRAVPERPLSDSAPALCVARRGADADDARTHGELASQFTARQARYVTTST